MEDLGEQLYFEREYQDVFCRVVTGTCLAPNSILRFFNGYWYKRGIFSEHDMTFDNVDRIVTVGLNWEFGNNPPGYFFLDHLGSDVIISNNRTEMIASSALMRVYIGYPLDGFEYGTKFSEQQDLLTDYLLRKVVPVLDPLVENGLGDMSVTYFHPYLATDKVRVAASSDNQLIPFVFVIIGIGILICSRSVFIFLMAIFGLISQLLTTNLIFKYAAGYVFLGSGHLNTIYVIVLVYCVDLFMYVSTYRHTRLLPRLTLLKRLLICHGSSSSTVYVALITATSIFTASSIGFFSSFGLFSLVAVLLTKLLTVIWFPFVLSVYSEYFEKQELEVLRKYMCCGCLRRNKPTIMAKSGKIHNREQKAIDRRLTKWSQKLTQLYAVATEQYLYFLTNPIFKWCIVVVFVLLTGVSIYGASTLDTRVYEVHMLSVYRQKSDGILKSTHRYII